MFLRCDLYCDSKHSEIVELHTLGGVVDLRVYFSWLPISCYTRTSYTASFKLRVVEEAEKTSNRGAGRKFGVNEKLVRDWRKKKDELMKLPRTAKSARPGMKPHWPELKNKLHEWILDKRLNGLGISEAKMMAKEMPPSDVSGFTGSTTWLYRYMKRKNLVVRAKTRIAQRLRRILMTKLWHFNE